tara:strand:- start:533 stop:880 length:348 start_codon:yes stop_codon:yes gene_type:complete
MGRLIGEDNYINVTSDYSKIHQKDKIRRINSKNAIFSKPVIIRRYIDRIEFIEFTSTSMEKPISFSLFYPHDNGIKWYANKISAELLPFGRIEFDEDESEEGKLVFYYEDVKLND